MPPAIGDMGRRRFLQLLGGTALAVAAGCTPRRETEIVPFARQAEGTFPGDSQFYATTLPYQGFGRGALVESVAGRPIKIDGNPDHPAALGGSDVQMQAALMDLYDDQRPRQPTWNGRPASLEEALLAVRLRGTKGLHILTRSVTSPTLQAALGRFGRGRDGRHTLRTNSASVQEPGEGPGFAGPEPVRPEAELGPEVRWHRYQPLWPVSAAFTRPAHLHYQPQRARTVACFACDFLGTHPDHLRLARHFVEGQPRLIVWESELTITGARAHERTALTPAGVERALWSLAAQLGLVEPAEPAGPLARALAEGGLVMAGESLSPAFQALAWRINERIGAVGERVYATRAVDEHPLSPDLSLTELDEALQSGEVRTLLILGGNPVFETGLDLSRAGLVVHHTLLPNETSARAQWMIPAAHELEAWGDLRSYDGTLSLVQPLIEPIYGALSALELVSALQGGPRTGFELLAPRRPVLQQGSVAGTAFPPTTVTPRPLPTRPPALESSDVVLFRPDFTLLDGELAGNAWLQECPRPLSRLVWGNAVEMAPGTAERLGLLEGQVVELKTSAGRCRGPVRLEPRQARGTVLVYLGHGRHGSGFDAYPLRGRKTSWHSEVTVSVTDQTEPPMPQRGEDPPHAPPLSRGPIHVPQRGEDPPHAPPLSRELKLVRTQEHQRMEGQELVRTKLPPPRQEQLTLNPGPPVGDVAWGMVIDLNKCIGCQACAVACQAENNIPAVGPDQVARGRHMHWIRVDRYDDATHTHFQPVPCMHCEDAPCEKVCPVGATMHSQDGLNQMVYNRCVGTRYCGNNCPYKVRRFNFLAYNDPHSELLEMARNPDVTVRDRGVMEKCTYCVQRIETARIQADKEDRPIREGEVVTACQAACPTRAIVFGNLRDPNSEVARMRAHPANYALLEELGTRPRTTYLARLLEAE